MGSGWLDVLLDVFDGFDVCVMWSDGEQVMMVGVYLLIFGFYMVFVILLNLMFFKFMIYDLVEWMYFEEGFEVMYNLFYL